MGLINPMTCNIVILLDKQRTCLRFVPKISPINSIFFFKFQTLYFNFLNPILNRVLRA
jgi:hypothetical protein